MALWFSLLKQLSANKIKKRPDPKRTRLEEACLPQLLYHRILYVDKNDFVLKYTLFEGICQSVSAKSLVNQRYFNCIFT